MKSFLIFLLITLFFSTYCRFPKAKSTRLCFLSGIIAKKNAILDFKNSYFLDCEGFVNELVRKKKCNCNIFPCNNACRSSVKWIKLTENIFLDFREHYFYGLGLDHLEILDLCDNEISSISKNTFKWIPQLRYLKLGDNRIQKIDIEGFNGLNSLQVLDLSHNPILSFDIKILNYLPKLKWLRLDANMINDDLLKVLKEKDINLY